MFCLHFAPPEFCTNIKCAVSLLAESSSPETNQQYRTKPQILCLIQNHILHNFEVSSHPLRLEEHARGNGHRHQLLEQQLACVRYCDLRYLGLVLATKAVKGVLLQIGHSNEPTQLANVNPVGIRVVKQAFLEEVRGAVRNHAVPLHLPESQPAVARAALHGLPSENLHGPARARVDLVVHHVLEPLVVGGPQENLASLEHAAGVPVVHGFVAALLVAALVQSRRDVLHRHVREGGGVALVSKQRGHLAHEALHQMADGHAGGDGVRVDHDVGGDAFAAKRHVLLGVGHSDGALLAVPRRKLVPDLRHAHGAHAHLDELEPLVVGGDQHLVDDARLRGAQRGAAVLLGVPLRRA
mmetsp:Transcript_28574/g.54587  ORF Transcript_28574/g.54587 Transcript_28574/m.54587 type:complete len:354 (-) Transcript_28574:2764-3825(-)